MGRKQSEKRRTVRQTLAFMAAALLTLSGCAGNSGGTVYLSAVSRLKLEISGDGMVREVEALNKAGSALLGDSAFDNRTSTETLDALIPLMQTEDADTVFVTFFRMIKTGRTKRWRIMPSAMALTRSLWRRELFKSKSER